ncbi:hypothetical protein AB0H83_28055 [Dactylosporangium sp. NPDC050688]|uniref:hypothetical protein n=1 Tax=Dactylosporangium sp. NPDC050688 TaxID=3157217 RepID=UPI0033C7DAFA
MRTAAAVLAIVSLGCLLSGCTRSGGDSGPLLPPVSPPAARSVSPTPVSTPNVPLGRTTPARSASASPSQLPFSEAYVSQCNGRPTGEQVVAAVRRARPGLPGGNGLTVKTGPLCAGVWQYTVLTVTGSEPLQVMSKGAPATLTVVTVGTDPCTVEVKATAPPALLSAASC